jgi:hypothetical protein
MFMKKGTRFLKKKWFWGFVSVVLGAYPLATNVKLIDG